MKSYISPVPVLLVWRVVDPHKEHEEYHLHLYARVRLKVDFDNDLIGDDDEQWLDGIQSNPTLQDTFNTRSINPEYESYGDNEIRCRKKELFHGKTLHPEKDWANPGCQANDQFGPTP